MQIENQYHLKCKHNQDKETAVFAVKPVIL